MATLNVKNLPDELYARLRARATRERRSIAQEVIVLLGDAMQSAEPLSLLELRGLGKSLWVDVAPGSHVKTERESWGS